MSRIRRSRLSLLALLLLIPVFLAGCSEPCVPECTPLVFTACYASNRGPGWYEPPYDIFTSYLCGVTSGPFCQWWCWRYWPSCTETPEGCVAMLLDHLCFFYPDPCKEGSWMQTEAIRLCEENPIECQEALEYMAHSLDMVPEGMKFSPNVPSSLCT